MLFKSSLISLLFLLTSAFPKSFFTGFDLEYTGKLIFYHVEDLNNDNLKDIMIMASERENGIEENWLSVYLQTRLGFSAKPVQHFKIDNQILVLDIGDVTGDFSKELVFLKEDALYYYVFDKNGFNLNAKQLFEIESVFKFGADQTMAKWDFVADLNGDAISEILIPNFNQCRIYLRNPTNSLWTKQELALAAESRAYGFYDPRFSVGNRISVIYSIPYIFLEDFNNDSKKDLMAVYEDSLLVFTQNDDGFFSSKPLRVLLKAAEIWRGAKIRYNRIGDKSERTFLMRITDLNNDGIIDAVYVWVSTKESIVNPKNELHVYYGRRHATDGISDVYFEPEPDQVIEPGGTQLVLDILDLNSDEKLDLVIPVVKLSITNIIKMLVSKRVELEAEIYLMSQDGVYPEKPNFDRKIVMKFSYRGGATSPVYEIADFNGDGLFDIMSSLEERQLVFLWGDKNDILQSSIGDKHNVLLPQDGDLVRVHELNGDNKNDVIIQYDENIRREELKRKLRVLLTN